MQRITRQATLNCDRFADLPTGTFFSLYYGSIEGGYYLWKRYQKTGDDTVFAVDDGRSWKFAQTAASSAAYILVPDGSPSIVPFDARANKQYVYI
jgi:hypothetical protein